MGFNGTIDAFGSNVECKSAIGTEFHGFIILREEIK